MEFGMDLKELHIVRSNLNTIKSHAFMHVRGIKYLDFSENTIGTIEDDAFSEVTKSENIFFVTLKIVYNWKLKWNWCQVVSWSCLFFLGRPFFNYFKNIPRIINERVAKQVV